jgi:hypothetical protein
MLNNETDVLMEDFQTKHFAAVPCGYVTQPLVISFFYCLSNRVDKGARIIGQN